MGREVALGVSVGPAILVTINEELRRARLASHGDVGQRCVGSRAMLPVDRLIHPLAHHLQMLASNGQFPDQLWHEVLEHLSVRIRGSIDQPGAIEVTAVGHRNGGVEHLQRCGQNKALADGYVVGVAGDPALTVDLPLPFGVWYQTGILSRQVNASKLPQTKE